MTVASEAGFQVGQMVDIAPGKPTHEVKKISAFGSLIFDAPLQFTHPEGTVVVAQVTAPAPAPAPMPMFAPGPAPMIAPLMPPSIQPPVAPANMAPNLVEHWTYFYYVYYYKTFLDKQASGGTQADATAYAQKMAPVFAYEQLRHMFKKFALDEAGRAAGVVEPLPGLPQGIALHSTASTATAGLTATAHERSQKELGLTLMTDLMAKQGINLEEDFPTSLLQAARADRFPVAWDRALSAAAKAMQPVRLSEAEATLGADSRHSSTSRSRSSLRGGFSLSVSSDS